MKIEELQEMFNNLEQKLKEQEETISSIKTNIANMEELSKSNNSAYSQKLEKIEKDNADLLKTFQASLKNKATGDNSNPELEKILGGLKK